MNILSADYVTKTMTLMD